MSPGDIIILTDVMRFPRVSGDEPGHDLGEDLAGQFSPRERG